MSWYADPTAYFSNRGIEQTANATEMWTILHTYVGWPDTSVAAVLGNVSAESTFNPWLWEGRVLRDKSSSSPAYYRDFNGGYGLIQWTPYPPTPHPNTQPYIDSVVAQQYPGYAPNFGDYAGSVQDGEAQTYFIEYDMNDPGNWFPCSVSYYKPAFDAIGVDIYQFRSMTAYEFVNGAVPNGGLMDYYGAFMLNYLRPNNNAAANRFWRFYNEAAYWLGYFGGVVPPTPVPSTPAEWVFYYLKRKKRGGRVIL